MLQVPVPFFVVDCSCLGDACTVAGEKDILSELRRSVEACLSEIKKATGGRPEVAGKVRG